MAVAAAAAATATAATVEASASESAVASSSSWGDWHEDSSHNEDDHYDDFDYDEQYNGDLNILRALSTDEEDANESTEGGDNGGARDDDYGDFDDGNDNEDDDDEYDPTEDTRLMLLRRFGGVAHIPFSKRVGYRLFAFRHSLSTLLDDFSSHRTSFAREVGAVVAAWFLILCMENYTPDQDINSAIFNVIFEVK